MSKMTEQEREELLQMRQFDLFSDSETLQIYKARKIYESRIIQPDKEIKDFIDFIKYERRLLSTSKERFNKLNIMEENVVVPLIAVRIKDVYAEAVQAFSDKIQFWNEYIKFLHQFKFYKYISEVYEQMLMYHDDQPDVWSRAITWEHHEGYDNDRVQELINRAQQKHPNSQTLYLTLFQVELENKRKHSVNKAIEHAEDAYANGKLKFPKIDFYIEMLKIVDKVSYARPIQQLIIKDMRETFAKSEICWHILAQRELHGITMNPPEPNFNDDGIKMEDDDSKSSFSKSQSSDQSVSLKPMRKRIEQCLKTYVRGIEHVDSTKMWSYFLNCMLELNKDLTTQSSMKKYALSEAFRLANARSVYLTEAHYKHYVELLYENNPPDETIERVLQKATAIYKESVDLWLMRLRYFIQRKNFHKIKDTFQCSRHYLGERGVEIWRWYLIYIKSNRSPPGELDRFIVELANQQNPVFNIVKSHVIELLENTTNTQRALDVCELFIVNYPECAEFEEWKRDLENKRSFNFDYNMGDGVENRNGDSNQLVENSFGRERKIKYRKRP